MDDLGIFHGGMGQYTALQKVENTSNPSIATLAHADDLHFVAQRGLLMSHWRPFIDYLVQGRPVHMLHGLSAGDLFVGNEELMEFEDDEDEL